MRYLRALLVALLILVGVPIFAFAATPISVTGYLLTTDTLYLDVPYTVYGGNFTAITTVDGVKHDARNLAIVNNVNNKLVYAGDVDGSVYAVGGVNSTLYFAGRFTHVNGLSRNRVAAISTNDWSIKPWKVNPAIMSGLVTAIAYDDTRIFLGTSTKLITTNQTTGDRLWEKTVTDGPIRALFAWHGTGDLFVGGLFETYDGHTQHGLVAVSMATGAVRTSFMTNLTPNSHVGGSGAYDGKNPLDIAADTVRGRIVVGIASAHANALMSFDRVTGAVKSDIYTPGDCQTVLVLGGGKYYFGGWHNSNPASVNPLLYAGLYDVALGNWINWNGPSGGNVPSDPGDNGGVLGSTMDLQTGMVTIVGQFKIPLTIMQFVVPT